jgi:hypothetical protein
MITTLIRKAIAPNIETILNEERTRLQIIISEMKVALGDIRSIRASDIADNISTYDIAQDISIDSYDIASNIEIDASDIEVDTRDLADRICEQIGGNISIDEENIQIDYSALGRHIVGNLDIDVSDIEIDYRNLALCVANELNPVEFEEADLEEIAHKISKYLNTNDRIDTLERKMDLILKYHGITPENA